MSEVINTYTPRSRVDPLLFGVSRTIGNGDYEVHRHTSVELVLVFSGRAVHVIDGVEYSACSGDVFVIQPRMIHALRQRRAFDEGKLSCVPDAFASLAPELHNTAGFAELFAADPPRDGASPHLRLTPKEFGPAQEVFLSMLDEYTEKRLGWQLAMRAGFGNLLVILSRALNRTRASTDPSLYRLNEVLAYLAKNFTRPLTLGGLAEKAGWSESQFVRVFRRHCGVSPIDYLIDLRLDRACRLLISSSRTVTQIAFECGFNDSNYFSRQFRQRIGLTPQAYRQG